MFKRMFIGMLVAVAAFIAPKPAQAQFGLAATFPLIAGDTLANTDTVFKTIQATAGYNCAGVQALVNKISGTVTGKLVLLGSMDGRNYNRVDSATLSANEVSSAYTPTYSNGAILKITGSPYVFYEVLVTSSTTVSAPVRVSYTLRREQVRIVN